MHVHVVRFAIGEQHHHAARPPCGWIPPRAARATPATLPWRSKRLWQAQTAEPAHAATLALLQSCADRFDFQTLIEYLRDTAELTEEDDIDN